MKKTATLILALSMILGTVAAAENISADNTALNNTRLEQNQADKEIQDALSVGIIENTELAWDEDITREQFCDFAYNLANKVKELPQAKLSENPFNDVMNYKINALYFVGVISGKEDHVFAPNDKLTREEAAVLLCRIAKYVGIDLPLAKVDLSYSDNDKISPWAVSSVYSLDLLNIMERTEEPFNPQSNVTVKQSVSALMKLYNTIKK